MGLEISTQNDLSVVLFHLILVEVHDPKMLNRFHIDIVGDVQREEFLDQLFKLHICMISFHIMLNEGIFSLSDPGLALFRKIFQLGPRF